MNRAVGWIYEPGSTFKIVTVSSALEEGLAKPTDADRLPDGLDRAGRRIIHEFTTCIPFERKGPLTLSRC